MVELPDGLLPMRSGPDALLIIVARAPVPGKTKTRLGEAIGMERAALLHQAFIADLANRFGRAASETEPQFDLAWSYSPATFDFEQFLIRSVSESAYMPKFLIPQPEDSFAGRLSYLFDWAIGNNYRRTLIMASDSPHLAVTTLVTGFDLLANHDVILGRVADGGYYVVGMRGSFPVLKQSVMSTASAADALVAESYAAGLRVAEMSSSFDVDVESDLRDLSAHLEIDLEAAPVTRAALVDLGLYFAVDHNTN